MTNEEQLAAVHVARGASYIFLQGIATNIMMVITFAIIARLITTTEMGTIAVLTMVIGACQLTASVGMPSGVTKFIAEHLATDDRRSAAGAFYQAIRTSVVLSVLLAFLVFISSTSLAEKLLGAPEQGILFQLLSASIIANAGLIPILNSAMLGLQKIREMATVGIAYSAVRQTLIVSLVFLTRSLQGLVIAWVVSGIFTSAIMLVYVASKLGPPSFSFDLKRLARFSFPLFLQDVANFIYSWFDRAMVLAYDSLSAVGIYNTAMTAYGVLAGVPGAIGTALLPAYSSLHGKSGVQSLEGAIKTASRYICYVGMPLALGLLATAKPALTLFVGEAYAEGATPLMVLSFFLAATILITSLTSVLIALGETTLSLKITIANVVTGVLLALLLVPPLGAVGASLVRGITMVLALAATVIGLRSKIRITFDKKALKNSTVASLIMAFAVVFVQCLQYSKYLLPLYMVTGALTYLAMLRILHAIKPSDTQLIKQYLGPRFEFALNPLEKYLVTD